MSNNKVSNNKVANNKVSNNKVANNKVSNNKVSNNKVRVLGMRVLFVWFLVVTKYSLIVLKPSASRMAFLLYLNFFSNFVILMINECRPILSVIILVTKQIGLPLRGRPILFITRMITDN